MLRFPIALILFVATTLSLAQDKKPLDYTLAVDVELVQLPVSVLDKNGHPFRDLGQQHFRVFEDRVQQDISLFKQEDVPISVGLVIDASGSMQNKLDRLNTAALAFVRSSNPEDETFIVSFADQANLEQDFTTSIRQLGRSLDAISPNGNTALHDAVRFAARHLERGTHEKKVLLVVSDGEDNKSGFKFEDVLEEIREADVIIYTVGLMSANGDLLSPFPGKAKKTIKKYAEVTGGRSFFPKSVDDVDEVCQQIARELRNQYTIGYRPSNEKMDGAWRKVTVQVSPPKGASKLRVRTKQGYYAPTPSKTRSPRQLQTQKTF
jgi:VWFA-related protein